MSGDLTGLCLYNPFCSTGISARFCQNSISHCAQLVIFYDIILNEKKNWAKLGFLGSKVVILLLDHFIASSVLGFEILQECE